MKTEKLKKQQNKNNIRNQDYSKLEGSKKVKLYLINDFVSGYFFVEKVLSSVFNKNGSEIKSIVQNCESEGEALICEVTKGRANKLLMRVESLKEEFVSMNKEQRLKFGNPPFLDGNIKNLTFRISQ